VKTLLSGMAANNTPDFRTISDFRKDHLKAWLSVFTGVETVSESRVGKTGSRSFGRDEDKSQCSKHKAMSYKRMKEKSRALKQKWLSY